LRAALKNSIPISRLNQPFSLSGVPPKSRYLNRTRRWFSKITLSKPPLPDERPIVVSIVPHPREIVEEIVRGSAKV
jgi:hypothetical protein